MIGWRPGTGTYQRLFRDDGGEVDSEHLLRHGIDECGDGGLADVCDAHSEHAQPGEVGEKAQDHVQWAAAEVQAPQLLPLA